MAKPRPQPGNGDADGAVEVADRETAGEPAANPPEPSADAPASPESTPSPDGRTATDDGRMATDETGASKADGETEFMTYASFGRRFFEVAVTRDRVEKAVSGMAGRPIDVGPMGVGPLGLAKVRANGSVGQPELRERDGDEHVSFDLVIPAELQMQIQIGLETYRFNADVRINLDVVARAAERLRVVIDVEPPDRRRIEVDLRAEGLRASVLQTIAGIEAEIKRTVAKFVGKEIDRHRKDRVIDVERALGKMTS